MSNEITPKQIKFIFNTVKHFAPDRFNEDMTVAEFFEVYREIVGKNNVPGILNQ